MAAISPFLAKRDGDCDFAQVNCNNGYCCMFGYKCVVNNGVQQCLFGGQSIFPPVSAISASGPSSSSVMFVDITQSGSVGMLSSSAPSSTSTMVPKSSGTSSGSSFSATADGTNTTQQNDGLPGGAIAGIVIGVLCLLALALGLLLCLLKKQKKNQRESATLPPWDYPQQHRLETQHVGQAADQTPAVAQQWPNEKSGLMGNRIATQNLQQDGWDVRYSGSADGPIELDATSGTGHAIPHGNIGTPTNRAELP